MIVCLRKLISTSAHLPIEEIVERTDIVYNTKALLNWINECEYRNLDTSEELVTYCIELELGWILINLTHGPLKVVQKLFYEQ